MKVYSSVDELVGKTPLLELKNIQKELNLNARIFAKLEGFNPAGSVKDRVALFMLNQAEKDGKITSGATVIEPTSGNTGIGLASLSASRGYKAILVMPDSMSVERIKLLKAYGAEVILTEGKKGMKGAIEKAEELNATIPNSIIVGQFENPANPLAHYSTTGVEIYQDTDGMVDFFVAGVGTGGTVSGTAKYLKEKKPQIQVVAFEPYDSPMITKGQSGAHKIQGIGANFIPKNYDKTLVDAVETVKTEDAYEMARLMAKKQGVLVGVSSGAALSVAVKLAKKEENKGKIIVALLPDSGDKYLSTDLFVE